MLLPSLRQALAALMVAVLVSACGGSGSSAPPPTGGITVTPGDGTATVNWTVTPGVKYWLFYARASSISTTDWINVRDSSALMDVSPPYTLTGLTNGTTYSFAVNGRNGDGPGGAGTPSVSVVPRPAGGTWKAGGTLGSNTIRSLTYGTNSADALKYYFAVGDAGNAYRSADGLTWIGLTAPANATINATLYTFGRFLTVGTKGSASYSTDMSTWSGASTGTTANLNALASNGALAVAVGDGGTILSSLDGITWTAITSPTTNNLYGVSYAGNGVWTAVGAGGTLLTSSNGTTWAAVASGTTADLRAVAGTLVAVGNGGTVVRSADSGLTWTAQTSGTNANLLGLHTTSSQIMAVGASGAVITSPDGITWTSRNSGTATDLYSVLGGFFSQYVAVGQSGISINSQ